MLESSIWWGMYMLFLGPKFCQGLPAAKFEIGSGPRPWTPVKRSRNSWENYRKSSRFAIKALTKSSQVVLWIGKWQIPMKHMKHMKHYETSCNCCVLFEGLRTAHGQQLCRKGQLKGIWHLQKPFLSCSGRVADWCGDIHNGNKALYCFGRPCESMRKYSAAEATSNYIDDTAKDC